MVKEPRKRKARRRTEYKKSQHDRAYKLITKLDELVKAEQLVRLNFSEILIKAVDAQKKRQRLAASGTLQCYERFSGDPNYYVYDIDPVSGTMTAANPPYQAEKPDCRACTN